MDRTGPSAPALAARAQRRRAGPVGHPQAGRSEGHCTVYRRTIITTYDRERPSGFTFEQVGVTAEDLGGIENILAYCRKKWPDDDFVVGEIREVQLKR